MRRSHLHVAGAEDAGDGGLTAGVRSHQAGLGQLHAQVLEQAASPRTEEAESQNHQVDRHLEFGARALRHLPSPAPVGLRPIHLDRLEAGQLPALPTEALRHHVPALDASLLVRRALLVEPREGGPGHVRGSRFRWLGQELELIQLLGPLSTGGSHTVGARITAAQHDTNLAPCKDLFIRIGRITGTAAVLLAEEVHCQVDAVEIGPRNIEHSWLFRTAGEAYGVVVLQQVVSGQILAGLHLREKLDSLFLHQADAPVEDVLLQLEIRDAVAKQSPDTIGLLQHRYRMPEAVQPLGSGQPRGPRPDHGDPLAGTDRWGPGEHPALFEAPLDHGQLELPDGHRLVVNGQGTGEFAGRWTHATSDLRKAVTLLQHFERFPPAASTQQRVLGWDETAQRATGAVAERDSAVHASLCLIHQLLFGKGELELPIVLYPLLHAPLGSEPSRDRDEAVIYLHRHTLLRWLQGFRSDGLPAPWTVAGPCRTRSAGP